MGFIRVSISKHPLKTNREENERAWRAPDERVKESNYNLGIKNPNAPADDHGDPAELLAEYQKLLDEVSQTRNALKAELQSALASHER